MTRPTSSPSDPGLPGIRDHEIRIRVLGNDPHAPGGDLIARVPAGTGYDARTIGEQIADQIARALADTAGQSAYAIDKNAIRVTDVDGTPSPAELAAELEHYKRILAALAVKLPGVLQLDADEYQSADPAGVIAVPAGDATMMFLPAALTAAPAEPDTTPSSDGPNLTPVPDALMLPDEHGRYRDPDVRLADAPTLARAETDQLDVLIDGAWRRLSKTVIDQDRGSALLVTRYRREILPPGQLIPARPAAFEGYGSDLTAAVTKGRQILTASGWRTIETAEYRPMADCYQVRLGESDQGEASLSTSIEDDEKILMRSPRVGWWV